MQRLTSTFPVALLASIITSLLLVGFSFADEPETPTKENTTIKTIMKGAHKAAPKGTGLLKKVAKGEASADEAKHLLALYKVMVELPAPKGDAEAWKERSGLLVKAVEAVIAGNEEGPQMLTKAANCKACHDAHKQ